MAQSTSSVGQGSNVEATVVRVLMHSRNMEIWCNWDLVEMSDESQKARCKFCGMLLAKESNTSLKKHIDKFVFCIGVNWEVKDGRYDYLPIDCVR
ncbi:hypothetical protein R6Q57_009594 [Mikania cordata]